MEPGSEGYGPPPEVRSAEIQTEEVRAAEVKTWEVPEPEPEAEPLWLTIYSDMMTNLMMFFLFLFATSKFDPEALKPISRAIREAFSGQARPEPARPPPKEVAEVPTEVSRIAKVEERKDGFRVVFPEPVLFPLASAELSAAARPPLEKLGRWLSDVNYTVIVEGHTDDLPIRGGRYRSNWHLSFERARTVCDALAAGGVAPERLIPSGYGEFRPVAPNDSAEHRALNRRIEILVLYKNPDAL